MSLPVLSTSRTYGVSSLTLHNPSCSSKSARLNPSFMDPPNKSRSFLLACKTNSANRVKDCNEGKIKTWLAVDNIHLHGFTIPRIFKRNKKYRRRKNTKLHLCNVVVGKGTCLKKVHSISLASWSKKRRLRNKVCHMTINSSMNEKCSAQGGNIIYLPYFPVL